MKFSRVDVDVGMSVEGTKVENPALTTVQHIRMHYAVLMVINVCSTTQLYF